MEILYVEMRYKPERALKHIPATVAFETSLEVEMRYKPERALKLIGVKLR